MNYQVKRINPFWISHPMIPTAIVIGAVIGLAGLQGQKPVVGILGAVIGGIAVLAAARPVVSAVLGTLGLFGGLVTFVFLPNLQAAGMSVGMKILSALLFSVFYMVLMDALVMVVAVLYNLFAGVVGLGAIRLELGADEAEPEAEAAEGGA